MASITNDPNFAGLEKTIGDDGQEIRVANLPRITFDEIKLETDHLTIFSFSYINTDMLRQEFNERVGNYPYKLDFTFSNVASAIVQSNTFIPPLSTTAEDALSPDRNNTSPQASIFQDLRGVFAASNRTLGGPNFATDTESSSGVSLAGFEDEISAMSVDAVNEEIKNTLSRNATVFSDLWVSRRRSDAVDLTFAFNEKLFLKQSSTFPKLYNNQAFAYLAQGLGGGISRIRVYRQAINPTLTVNENSLNTTSKSSLLFGRDQEKEYISVGARNQVLLNDFSDEIHFGAGGERGSRQQGLMFVTCTDYENENARNVIGKTFRYGVEIDYVDPSVDMVLRMTNGLLEKAQEFRDIANDLGTMPSDTPEDRLKLHNSTEVRCNRILGTYAPLLDNLSSVNVVQGATEVTPYLMQLKGSSEQTVYERAEGISRIADLFEFYGSELEIELRKTVPGIEVYPGDDSPEAANYASSAGSGAGSTSRSINTIEYTFKRTVAADQGAGYDYLRYDPASTTNPGLEVVTLTDFISRCDIETEKYFNDAEGVRGLTTTKVKYFTPAVILDPLGKALVQSSETLYDYKRYVDFTAGIISYNEQKSNLVTTNNNNLGPDIEIDTSKLFMQELQNRGVSIEFNTDKNRSKDPLVGKSPFSSVALGVSNKEVSDNNQEDLKDRDGVLQGKRGEEQEKRDVKTQSLNVQKGLSNLLGPMALVKNNSGVSESGKANSFTKVVLDTPEREFEDLSLFPNQLKAMVNIVLSKYNQDEEEYDRYNYNFEEIRPLAGPDNQQSGLTDPMRDYSRFASYWLNFKQIKKIEVLVDFGKTSSDQINIASAVWREINLEDINTLPPRSVMFCRFTPLVGDLVEMLGLNAPNGLDLPLYNQYFLLTRTDEERDVRIIQEEIEEQIPEPRPSPEFQIDVPDLLDVGRVLENLGNNVIPRLNLPEVVLPNIPNLAQPIPQMIAPTPMLQDVVRIPEPPRPSPVRNFENLVDVVNRLPNPAPRVRENNLQRVQIQQPLPQARQPAPRQQAPRQQAPRQQAPRRQAPRQRGGQQLQVRNLQRVQAPVVTPRRGLGNFGRGLGGFGGGGY